MTEVLLIRHGETEWNREEIFRGRIDVELSQAGLKQAMLLAEHLAEVKLEAIYCSPLKRALKTAQAIAGHHHHLTVQVSPALADMDFGTWQGMSRREVSDRYPELYAQWASHPHKLRMPSGDSLGIIRRRAMRLVKQILATHQGTVALVSHRVVNKVLICALLRLDNSHFWNIRQDVCGVTAFTHENGGFVLTRHNDTSFLRPPRKSPLRDF